MPKVSKPRITVPAVCVPVKLSESLQQAAAEEAIRINPANAPAMTGILRLANVAITDASELLPTGFIAALTSKYWGSKGVDLKVGFMETTKRDLAERILNHLNAWGERANVVFRLTDTPSAAEVRISRKQGGYWSYLGTDILQIPKNRPTMNLQGFSMNTSINEFNRVVEHEGGHTLGFPHEHARRDIVALLDEAKVIDYFRQTQGWSEDEVREQILTPLPETTLVSPTPADQTSIMTYQFPGTVTKNGRPILGGGDITEQDHAYAAKIYPKAVNPPPPPGGGSPNVPLAFTLNTEKKTVTVTVPEGYTLVGV